MLSVEGGECHGEDLGHLLAYGMVDRIVEGADISSVVAITSDIQECIEGIPPGDQETHMNPVSEPISFPSFPLLNSDEEKALAESIRTGVEAQNRLLSSSRLSRVTAKKLQTQVNLGHIAKRKFVESNLRLVRYVANSYVNRGLDIEDLVQEGTIGLMHAVEKFDPSRGYRFSTYAVPWIRQAISRAVGNTARAIRLPENQLANLARVATFSQRFKEENGSMPSPAEIAEETGLSVAQVATLLPHLGGTVSLHLPVGEDSLAELADFIESDEVSPEDYAEQAERAKAVHILLELLTEKERIVISRRYGLAGDSETLADVARDLKVSRERVRQIEAKAMAKLRHPALAKQFL